MDNHHRKNSIFDFKGKIISLIILVTLPIPLYFIGRRNLVWLIISLFISLVFLIFFIFCCRTRENKHAIYVWNSGACIYSSVCFTLYSYRFLETYFRNYYLLLIMFAVLGFVYYILIKLKKRHPYKTEPKKGGLIAGGIVGGLAYLAAPYIIQLAGNYITIFIAALFFVIALSISFFVFRTAE